MAKVDKNQNPEALIQDAYNNVIQDSLIPVDSAILLKTEVGFNDEKRPVRLSIFYTNGDIYDKFYEPRSGTTTETSKFVEYPWAKR